VIFKPEAKKDIVDAVQWYEQQRVGLGIRFRSMLEKVFSQMEVLPELYRVIYKDVRRASTPGFPFSIYYRIDEGEVVVLAVVHASRDPERWKSRV